MDTGLTGRVAAITGAAGGIGRACAEALAAEGCRIVAADLAPPERGIGDGDWEWVAADVSSPDASSRIVDIALSRWQRIDALVACAGIYETSALDELDVDGWDRVQQVNLRGTYLCARAAITAMRPRRWGRVVTFSSIAAQTGGLVAGPAYVASKAAIAGLTRSLANAAGPDGITVNCVSPGIIETPMTAVIDGQAKRQTAQRAALRRNGNPQDVAAVVVMLCARGAGFVTGACIPINGGLAMS